ncbi:lactonase family protein [Streptomyces sp. IBSNAI002]|uniref:lactonase family protein n=1 Tax=Streptomyces sp. IBSNAI002 TaxID=3457500 RepID=UPI003FD04712
MRSRPPMRAGGPVHAHVSSYRLSGSGGPQGTAITVCRVDPQTGALTAVQEVYGAYPSWIAIDRRGGSSARARRKRAAGGGRRTGAVTAYVIDPRTGALRFLDQVSLGEGGPARLAVSPDGRHLLVADYYGGACAVVPIGPDGRPGSVSIVLRDAGGGPHPRQMGGPHPHAVAFDPRGRFIGAADLGSDRVQILRLDGDRLQQVGEKPVAPGTGPRHVSFSPDGATYYVVGELEGNIRAFACDAEAGRLGEPLQTVTTQPPGFSGVPSGADAGGTRGSVDGCAYRRPFGWVCSSWS